MAFSIKTSISFGMVYIPVSLEAAVKKNEIGFHQLDKNTGSRIRYKKTCDECDGEEVTGEDIVRAYQYEKGRYVTLSDEELDKIKTKKDKSIAIERFVDIGEIDPFFYDKPYFVLPAGADKAYELLRRAMEKENKVGIAKTVLGTKETLVALIVRDGFLTLSTMHFYDEIKSNPLKVAGANGEAYGKPKGAKGAKKTDSDDGGTGSEADEATGTAAKVSGQEMDLACSIIKNMEGTFVPKSYKDEYAERVMAAIGQKIAGKEITAPKEGGGKIIDLMEALKQSLITTSSKSLAKSSEKPEGKSVNISGEKHSGKSTANAKGKPAGKSDEKNSGKSTANAKEDESPTNSTHKKPSKPSGSPAKSAAAKSAKSDKTAKKPAAVAKNR